MMLTLAAFLLPSNAMADEPWVEYNNGTLTFKYGEDIPDEGTVYDLNKGSDSPAWSDEHTSDVTSVVFDPSFANARPTTCCKWFYGMNSLTNIEGMKYLNTEEVTNMAYMFASCSDLSNLDVSSFNTGKVTDMSYMFANCSMESLDLSNFNTEKVTNMSCMFYDCGNLITIYASNKFDITSVDYFDEMFFNCGALEGAVNYADKGIVDKSMANYTDGYFTYKPTTLNEAWVEFDSGKQTLTFKYGIKPSDNGTVTVYGLNEEHESPEWNTSTYTSVVFEESFSNARPTTCYEWFNGQSSLTSITGLGYLNTEKVTNMSYMFYECTSLEDLGLASFNTANVEDMSYMFYECTALESLDVSKFNTKKVTNMIYMFYNCEKLSELNLSGFNTANATDMSGMFEYCGALESLDLSKFNTEKVTDMNSMFSGCSKLEDLDLSNFNTEKVTSMYYMFAGCTALKNLTVSSLNTANVENMGHMFSDCNALDNIDVSKFNTEKVTSMESMFYNCSSLKNLDLANFNTASVTDMSLMFAVCSTLKSLDLSSFNTASVTDMIGMFNCCKSLTTIFVKQFVVNDGINTEDMFSGCTALVGAESCAEGSVFDGTMANYENGYFKCKKEAWAEYDSDKQTLTFKYEMNKASSSGTVTVYDLNEGDDQPEWNNMSSEVTSVVFEKSFADARPTTCRSWFKLMQNLTSIEGLEYLNTENVTDMTSMFAGCSALENLDLSNFNTANVTDMTSMFYECETLAIIYVGDKFDITNVKDSKNMFYGCLSLAGDSENSTDATMANCETGYFTYNGTYEAWAEYDSNKQTLTFKCGIKKPSSSGTVTVYGLNEGYESPEWNSDTYTYTTEDGEESFSNTFTTVVFEPSFSNARPTTCYGWFDERKTLTSITGLEYLNTEEVTNMSCMFYNCTSLTDLDVSNFNTGKVTDMSQMFDGCEALKKLDVSNFNTANVTDMHRMFFGCITLDCLDLSNFNTANVTEMYSMFEGCAALTGIELSSFNTKKVTDMIYMFYGCEALKSLDLSSFNTANVTDMNSMFYGCKNLTTIYVKRFDVSGNANTGNMFADCTSLVGAKKYDETKTDGSMANYTTGYFTKIAVNEAWAEYDSDKKTLTFKYGIKPESSGSVTVFYLNEEDSSPEWNNKTYTSGDEEEDGEESFCSPFTTVVFDESFSNAQPTTCYEWFKGRETLESIEGLEYLNTEKVTDMRYMFYDCSELKKLDVSNFNTENVTDMNSMFFYCSTLESLDLSGFNTANVTNMDGMFKGCDVLTTIYASDKFDITKVYSSDVMFEDCKSLVGVVRYDSNNTDANMANYKTGYFKTYYRIGDTKHDLCGETLSVTDLVLEDGKDFVALVPFTATNASYSRTMTSNWGTLCLPFAVETTSTADSKFYGIESVDNDVITLSQLDGTIDAGTPVLVYSTNGLNISASSVDVVTEPTEGAEANGWHLLGSFAETEVPDDGYIISKNKFWLTSDLKSNASVKAVKTKGLRAWLWSESDSSEAKAHVLGFAFDDEDETSAIDAIDGLTEGTAEIYDIQGHRINSLQKGLNIVKMGNVTKKVMVK